MDGTLFYNSTLSTLKRHINTYNLNDKAALVVDASASQDSLIPCAIRSSISLPCIRRTRRTHERKTKGRPDHTTSLNNSSWGTSASRDARAMLQKLSLQRTWKPLQEKQRLKPPLPKNCYKNVLVVTVQTKSIADRMYSYWSTNFRGQRQSCMAMMTWAPKLKRKDMVTNAWTAISHGGSSHSLIT